MLDHLPHHIFLEILYRIPANFLVKCMSVSKTWYSIIKSADFIYSHLTSSISRNPKDPHLVRLLMNEGEGFSLHFESFESHEHFHKQLDMPPQFGPRQNLWTVGYSNGIFCYALCQDIINSSLYYQYLLWNPSIQKYFTLPPSNYEDHFVAAFVFDSNVNDFKVLGVRSSFEVELYSLRNRSWKIISVRDPNLLFYFNYTYNCTFVDGVIYFTGAEGHEKENLTKYYIICFNLADEVFHKIMLPESLGRSHSIHTIPYGNTSIAVVAYCYENVELNVELWAMEEISASGIWKKLLFDISCMTEDGVEGVGDIFFVVRKGKVFFENESGRVISLDLNSQQIKDVGLIQKIPCVYNDYNSVHRYEENLALFDIGKDISMLEEEYLGVLDNEIASDSDSDFDYPFPLFV